MRISDLEPNGTLLDTQVLIVDTESGARKITVEDLRAAIYAKQT